MLIKQQFLRRNALFIWGSLFVGVTMLAAIVALHALPLRAAYDVGAQPAPISRLYAPEYNATMSYAYSQGQSLILAPMAGAGAYEVLVRMGGLADAILCRRPLRLADAALISATLVRCGSSVSWRTPMVAAYWRCA